MIYLGIISLELSILLFLSLYSQQTELDFSEKSLELILTINGLFSAILVTYFFNRISWVLSMKKETYNEAVEFSQKITEFRRICDKLTQYYGVWADDKATKSLLEHNEYKHIDYYEYKMYYKSDYKPNKKDLELIEKLRKDERYKEGLSDLFLGMVSLVRNRKSRDIRRPNELYKDFQKKGIYNLEYIEKCVECDYASTLWYWFSKDYAFINYHALSNESKEYGLVNYVVSLEELLPLCEKLANKISYNSSSAIASAIKAVNASNTNNGFNVEIQEFGKCFETHDFNEGTTAFLQKRKPNFK